MKSSGCSEDRLGIKLTRSKRQNAGVSAAFAGAPILFNSLGRASVLLGTRLEQVQNALELGSGIVTQIADYGS